MWEVIGRGSDRVGWWVGEVIGWGGDGAVIGWDDG